MLPTAPGWLGPMPPLGAKPCTRSRQWEPPLHKGVPLLHSPKLPIVFIVMTIVIDAMGIGLIIPVMPQLLLEILPTATLGQAAIWGGIMAMLFSLMQFLFGPMLGSLSDQYGRKPLLLVTLVIMALGYLIMALAGGIWLLLFGRIIGGISSATQSTAAAYIADISKFGLV